jgi:hypothetical protein
MSTARSFLYFAVAGALAFAASSCGGGGGGSTAFQPPVLPSACPSPNNVYPPLDCSQYTTSGTSTQTVTRYYPTPAPPPAVTNIAVQQQITVHDRKSFHGTVATDFHTVETDAGPNQAITTTSDVYLIFPSPNPGAYIVNIGFHSTDSNGVVLDVQNLSGNGIVGEVPLPNSGPGWVNNAAQIISETDPDGTQTNITVNDDGTYNLTKNEVAGETTACDNSNGSGSANIPSSLFFAGATSTDVSVTAPSQTNQVTFTLTGLPSSVLVACPSANPTPTPVASPIVEAFPAWYALPVVIASDQTTIEGTTAVPAGCTGLAANGTQLHEVKSSLDPVFGTTDTETNDTWVASSFGPVCQEIAETQDIYYDFTGQSNPIVLGLLTQETQSSELLGLQTAARADSVQRVAGKQSLMPLPLGVQAALANARLERMQILTRLRLLRALEHRTERGFLL